MKSELVDEFKKIKILCIGDIMIDRFIYGDINRISPEAPVQVFEIKSEKEMLGGCGNVVANLATLGCRAKIIGIVGDDKNGRTISKLLNKAGCLSHLLKLSDYSTTEKTRLIAGNTYILRTDREEKLPIIDELIPKFIRVLEKAVKDVDIVILSDYDKGLLTPQTAQLIIKTCQKFGKKVIVDPKGNDYSKYTGAYFVKPNFKEFQEATGRKYDFKSKSFYEEITKEAKKILKKYKISNLLVTLGEKGIIHVPANLSDSTTHGLSEAKEVFDVSGAGDTTLATFTLAIMSGLDIPNSIKMANLAAGIVVGKLGTASVTKSELKRAIANENFKYHIGQTSKIITVEQAIELVKEMKSEGKIIGFTNGYFDLLHIGHINSFAEAKKACDYLFVGINSDKSVKLLKDHSKPIQDEKTRSYVIASLEFVDYVILFDETTALPLVEKIQPSIIAKEGYAIKDWPEAQKVISYGGKAIELKKIENFSNPDLNKPLEGFLANVQ